jgi:hypothetical protein
VSGEVPTGEPIGRIDGGTPSAYGALGAVFHLELLSPADEERLDLVNDLVWSWFGGELRWTLLSSGDDPEPARRSHIDHISTYPATLEGPLMPDPELQVAANVMQAFGRADDSGLAHGGASPGSISPYSYRFWCEIGAPRPDSPSLAAVAALEITVPEEWPLADFYARITQIAAALELRWGAAGYTYSVNELSEPDAAREAVYAHARRYPGRDTRVYIRNMDVFYVQIRTVNWLTFIGPAMVKELESLGRRLEGTPQVAVEPLGSAVMLRAGAQPERGDINRLRIPPAYREADAMVRPLRAREGIDFLPPWDEATTSEWLTRFERRVF